MDRTRKGTIVQAFKRDEFHRVEAIIFGNMLPPGVWMKLVKDKRIKVITRAVSSVDCPTEVLEKLALNDKRLGVLYAIALHPNCPQHTRHEVMKNKEVAEYVNDFYYTRQDFIKVMTRKLINKTVNS